MGPMGRATLAQDLNSTNFSVAGKTLGLMGTLGGPIANVAIQGLRSAMTADNFAQLAKTID